MRNLSIPERKQLKARAHALKPVVAVGNDGLSPAVIREIDASLKAHELIKIRVSGEERAEREALLSEICVRTRSTAVQHIGKILVIYRENTDPPAPVAKKKKERKGARRTKQSYQNE